MTNSYKPGSPFELRSPYGNKTDPFTGIAGKFHSGQDFAAPAGTPGVRANATDDVPIRRLGRRVVNLSGAPISDSAPDLTGDPQSAFDDRFGNWTAPSAGTARVPDQPAPPSPVLGIFSGKPMREFRLSPSVWGLPDKSSNEGVDAFRRLWRQWLDAQ